MFKRTKRKSNEFLKDTFKKEASNFKSGSITMSTKHTFINAYSKIEKITAFGLPDQTQQFRIVTKKAINSFDFILSIIHKEIFIEQLYIAFYRVGKKTINELNELQKNRKIGTIVFLINDGFPKLVKDAYNLLKSFESCKWVIKLENNHTKIILARTATNHFVVEGSGNLSINARIEQYVFDNNKELYNFHKTWINEI